MANTSEQSGGSGILWLLAIMVFACGVAITKNQGNITAEAQTNVGIYTSVTGAVSTVEGLDDMWSGQKIGTKYSVSKDEFILLCNLVYREAGNGQLDEWEAALVVETVMNRCSSDQFPSTISSVIRQRNQFPGQLSMWTYDQHVNYYVKDVVLSYLNGYYANHGVYFYWGDSKHNYFYKTEQAHSQSYYVEYLKWGVHPQSIVNYY